MDHIRCACVGLALLGWATGSAYGQDAPTEFDGSAGWIDEERHRLPEWEPAMPEPNGFDVYQRAWELCEREGIADDLSEWVASILRGTAMDAPTALASLRAEADRHAEALALLHEAADMEHLAPVTEDLATPLPWLSSRRQLARLLLADAIAAYDGGEMDRAFGSLADAYAMSTRVAQGGALIDLLVGHAIFTMCQRTQALFLQIGAADADTLAAHARRLHEIASEQSSLRLALIREGKAWLSFMDQIAAPAADGQGAALVNEDPSLPATPAPAGLSREDLTNIRAWMEDRLARLAAAADEPAVATHIHRLLERTPNDLRSRNDPLAEALMPALTKVYDGHLSQREGWVTAELLPALEAFRKRDGSLPGSISGLTPSILPALPTEPWTGEPPLYRLAADGGFLIYSPGFDGIDDGGEMSVLEGNRGPDIVLYPPHE